MTAGDLGRHPPHEHYFTWIKSGEFHIGWDFAVDKLTMIMLMIVTGIGSLIHIYATGYMAHEEGYYRFFAYLNLFMFFMLTWCWRELPDAVRRLGRRRPVQLPADRLLLREEERHHRRQQGVHREPHRRLRILARHVPDRGELRHAGFHAGVLRRAGQADRNG
jgi:hypothetical protein